MIQVHVSFLLLFISMKSYSNARKQRLFRELFFHFRYSNQLFSIEFNLNMEQQITTICKSAFLHIRNIKKVRKYLPQHAAETVVNALVTSRLDNCNALLLGLPKNLLQKLKYVQNSAARLIMGTNKCDHIRPVLKKLHWLPIDNRIVFKVLLLTFKAGAKLAPQYIQDLINDYTPN